MTTAHPRHAQQEALDMGQWGGFSMSCLCGFVARTKAQRCLESWSCRASSSWACSFRRVYLISLLHLLTFRRNCGPHLINEESRSPDAYWIHVSNSSSSSWSHLHSLGSPVTPNMKTHNPLTRHGEGSFGFTIWFISAFIPEACCSVLERSGPCLVKLWSKKLEGCRKGPGHVGILCGKKHRGSSVPSTWCVQGIITLVLTLRGGHWLQRFSKQFTKYFYHHHALGILNKVSDDTSPSRPPNLCHCRSGNVAAVPGVLVMWCQLQTSMWSFLTLQYMVREPWAALGPGHSATVHSGCESMLLRALAIQTHFRHIWGLQFWGAIRSWIKTADEMHHDCSVMEKNDEEIELSSSKWPVCIFVWFKIPCRDVS